MGKKRQPKASELFAEGKLKFSQPSDKTFEEAYPTIEEVEVVVVETGDKIYSGRMRSRTHTYSKKSLGEFIDCCSNPDCYGGGHAIGITLDSMVHKKETHREFSAPCGCAERTPTGRVRRACLHHFNITVDIEYKESESKKKD